MNVYIVFKIFNTGESLLMRVQRLRLYISLYTYSGTLYFHFFKMISVLCLLLFTLYLIKILSCYHLLLTIWFHGTQIIWIINSHYHNIYLILNVESSLFYIVIYYFTLRISLYLIQVFYIIFLNHFYYLENILKFLLIFYKLSTCP